MPRMKKKSYAEIQMKNCERRTIIKKENEQQIRLPTRARMQRNELTEEELIAYRAKEAEKKRNYRARLGEEELKRRRAIEAEKKRIQRAQFYHRGQGNPSNIKNETLEHPASSEDESVEGSSSEITNGIPQHKHLSTSLTSEEIQLLEIERLTITVRALKNGGLEIIRTRVADAVRSLLGQTGSGLNNGQLKVRELHNNTSSNSREMFPCPFCTMEYAAKKALTRHLHTHPESGSLGRKWPAHKNRKVPPKVEHPCEVCPEKFFNIVEYRKHLLEYHKENTELIKKNCFSCPFCAETFLTKKASTHHLRDLHEIFVQCPVCDECIANQAVFTEHVNTSHSHLSRNDRFLQYSGRFICKMCGLAQRKYGTMILHYQNIHSGLRIFQCDCGKAFSTKNSLRNHKNKSHGEKSFCEKCGRIYKSKRAFKRHIRTHEDGNTDEKPRLPCIVPGCTKTSIDKRSRRLHFLKAHKPGRSDKNKLPCPVCGKEFSVRSSLTTHLETICEKESAKKAACDTCGKVLDNTQLLNYHRNNTHKFGNTSETFCHRCQKDYSSCYSLYGHNIRFHRNKSEIPNLISNFCN